MRNADLYQLSAGTLIVPCYTIRAARLTHALTRLPKNNTFAPIPSGRASCMSSGPLALKKHPPEHSDFWTLLSEVPFFGFLAFR